MNLYCDDTKKNGARKEEERFRIHTCICCARVKDRKVKASFWKQKEQWETKGNSRISHSTYGRVVSQSHCCATPQEYEWAKSSPHFIIFFRLCVSEVKQDEERRRWEKKEIKIAPRFLVYVSLDWKFLLCIFLCKCKLFTCHITCCYRKISWRHLCLFICVLY